MQAQIGYLNVVQQLFNNVKLEHFDFISYGHEDFVRNSRFFPDGSILRTSKAAMK